MVEPFLRLFQSDKSVVPFIYQELEKNVWTHAKVYQVRYSRYKQVSVRTDEI